ncbi:MAG: hypothetical protein NZ553_11365 [Caldilinea sp.]|nr:hypothetical protein [Caldilinea sp.]MDW8441064.1 hypothetical protein [Caldilineaceae bacterium]
MFTRSDHQMWWGALLILLGVFLLLQATGILGALSDLFWALAFTAAGSVFLYTFLTAVQERWWAALPGFTLLGLAATIFYGRFAPPLLAGVGGAIFLGSIGLGFWAVFITNPRRWWAIIPGGVLVSLAGVAALDAMRIGFLNPASVLFVGLGATFGVLGAMAGHLNRNLRWAYIPAAILLFMGVVVMTPFVGVLAWLWPLALIVVGAYLIVRQLKAPSSSPLDATERQADNKIDAPTALAASDERVSGDVTSR